MVNARDTVRQHNYETHLEVYALTNYRHLVKNNTRAFVNETDMDMFYSKLDLSALATVLKRGFMCL